MALSKNNLIGFALLVSLALLAVVFANTDLDKVIFAFKSVKLPFLALALATLFLELILKSWRLKILVGTHKQSSFWDNFIVTLVGLPFGAVTPVRFGDLAKVYTLSKKTSLSNAECLAIGVMEKVLDFFSLFILAASGTAALLVIAGGLAPVFLYLLVFIAVSGLLVFILLNKNLAGKFLKLVFGKAAPFSHKNLLNNFDDFYSGLSKIFGKKILLLESLGLAFSLWLNRLLRIFILALALNIEPNFFYFLLFIPIVEIVEILPIAIMGFGTREYAYVLLLSFIGISRESSVALSLLNFSIVTIPFFVIGYLAVFKEHVLKDLKKS